MCAHSVVYPTLVSTVFVVTHTHTHRCAKGCACPHILHLIPAHAAYFPEYGPMAGTMPPLPRTNSLYAQAATSKAAQPQAPAAAAAPAAAGGTAAQPRAPSARAAPPAAPPPVKAVHAPSPRAVSPSPPSRA
eukprot:scaffold20124_cov20-Tisochrysis_lutea.AAC.2